MDYFYFFSPLLPPFNILLLQKLSKMMYSETPQSDQGEYYSYSVGDLIWKKRKFHKKKYYQFLSVGPYYSLCTTTLLSFNLTFLYLGIIRESTEEIIIFDE